MIEGMVSFPWNAESSPMFGALASALLPALGYREDTPYYCAPKGRVCTNCGDCGDATRLQRHHLQLYHDLLTTTGVGLLWGWPEDLDDRIGRALDLAGVTHREIPPEAGRDALFAAIKESVDAGVPVLMKLGGGADWHVATGYDADGRLYGLDAHAHYDASVRPAVKADGYTQDGLFILADWFAPLRRAVVITGRREEPIGLPELLDGMIRALDDPTRDALEREVVRKIDALAPENALETARRLNDLAGFPIEARWHVASCTDSTLPNRTGDARVREKLLGVTAQYVFDNDLPATHGTCWKIWAQLGVGPKTGYAVPENAAEYMHADELKRLFAIVFENDRIALSLLREARDLLG